MTINSMADLQTALQQIPYAQFLGITCREEAGEPLFVLPFKADNIGNTLLPAIHGGVIGGFLETLADMDAPEPDVTRQFLPMMMEQAKRMQSLVEDLLTLARLEG